MTNTPERSIELPSDVTAPGLARRFVRTALREIPSLAADVVDTIELLVSEVVTNCVLHARSRSRLALDADPGGRLRVEVCDKSPLPPEVRQGDPERASGQGMVLVQALATRWGHRGVPGDGKCVWFEVEA